MKIRAVAFAVLAVLTFAARANTVAYSVSADFSLAKNPGNVSLASASGSGFISGIACRVTEPVSGFATFSMKGTIDGEPVGPFRSIMPYLYFFSPNFTQTWTNAGPPVAIGNGSNVGDSVYYTVHIPFLNAFTLYSENLFGTQAQSGSLRCTVNYLLTGM